MKIGDKGIYKGPDENYLSQECEVVSHKNHINGIRVKFNDGKTFYTNEYNFVPIPDPFFLPNKDNVTKPAHYHKGNIDTIAFCNENFNTDEMRGAYKFNVIKYVHRYRDKNGLEDLKKAEFYLKKLIELEENHEQIQK